MIKIGLTGWSDHPLITPDSKRKLEDYSSHFPIVEMDTSFYGIPTEKNIKEWIYKTPKSFQFIPKAYAAMTRHRDWQDEYTTISEMFTLFKNRFSPMYNTNRIKTFLFQFPPFFRFNQKNIAYLKLVYDLMNPLPVAVEFRHPSWFNDENKKKTIKLLKKLQFIHTVVDQPQTPGNSVGKILKVTNKKLAMYRLHGRNYSGWLNANEDPDWRKHRTLYDYSTEELKDIQRHIQLLETEAHEVVIIFNNNSGLHAAKNAKELQDLLNIEFDNLHPQQLNLF